jgi:hypothetical protein
LNYHKGKGATEYRTRMRMMKVRTNSKLGAINTPPRHGNKSAGLP